MSTQAVVSELPAEQTFFCFVQSKQCAGKALKATEAYVPSVSWMFWVVRFSDIDKNNPLTNEEIGAHVRCAFHSCGPLGEAYNKENGISAIFSLDKTLALMARWREVRERKTVQSLERKLRRACEKLATAPVASTSKAKNYGTYVEKTKVAKAKPDGQKKNKGGKQRGSRAH